MKAEETYMMGRGVVSAARMTISDTPRFKVSVGLTLVLKLLSPRKSQEMLTSALVGALLKLAVVAWRKSVSAKKSLLNMRY